MPSTDTMGTNKVLSPKKKKKLTTPKEDHEVDDAITKQKKNGHDSKGKRRGKPTSSPDVKSKKLKANDGIRSKPEANETKVNKIKDKSKSLQSEPSIELKKHSKSKRNEDEQNLDKASSKKVSPQDSKLNKSKLKVKSKDSVNDDKKSNKGSPGKKNNKRHTVHIKTIDTPDNSSSKDENKKKSRRNTVYITPSPSKTKKKRTGSVHRSQKEDKKKRSTVHLTPSKENSDQPSELIIGMEYSSSTPKLRTKDFTSSKGKVRLSGPTKTLMKSPSSSKPSTPMENDTNLNSQRIIEQDSPVSQKREKMLTPKAPSSSSLNGSQNDSVNFSLSFRNDRKRQSVMIKDFKTLETEFNLITNEDIDMPSQMEPSDTIYDNLRLENTKSQLIITKDVLNKSKRNSMNFSPLRNSLFEANKGKSQGKVAELTKNFENSRMLKRPSSSNVQNTNDSLEGSSVVGRISRVSSNNGNEELNLLKYELEIKSSFVDDLQLKLQNKEVEIKNLKDLIREKEHEIEMNNKSFSLSESKIEEIEKLSEEKILTLTNENELLKKKINKLELSIANFVREKTRRDRIRSNSVKLIANNANIKKETTKSLKVDSETLIKSMLSDLSIFVIKITPTIAHKSDLDRRTRIILEIFETEQNYVSGLSILMNNWNKPFLEVSKSEPKISEADIQKIFADGSLELIFLLNKKLCESIEKRLEQWTENSCIGDIFDEWAPRMAPYRRYSSKYEEISNFIATMNETNPKFKKILSILNDHSMNFNGLRITDYLITPVQRIPRYNLLLRDLLSTTSDDHPDKENLVNAIEKISQTATTINETIRQAESQTKMAEIVQRGGGFENLVRGNQYRRFIYKSNVDLLINIDDRKKGNKRQPELLLFNDVIVAGNFVTKKSASREFSISVKLLWVVHDGNLIPTHIYTQYFEPHDILREHALLFKGPDTTWCVGIRDKSERNNWIEFLSKTIGISNGELQTGNRNGKHDFLAPVKGTYEGEWCDCEFSGYGTYVRQDGTLFEGNWDHRFKAGFGTITSSGQTKGGWKNNRPLGEVELFTDHQFWDVNNDLTERDWSLLLTGAKDIIFKKNQVVIEQDVENTNLYKIKIGKCRVEKDSNGNRKVVGMMNGNAIFGDTSVLPSMKVATARVVSDNDTLLQVIEVSILFEVLKTSPTLSMKFFRYIAIKLAQRLKNLHSTPSKKPKKKTISKIELDSQSESAHEDDEFREKFDLPKTEVIIKSSLGVLKGVIKKYGTLYVSQKYICFESSVFGMTSKEVIHFSKVIQIEVNAKKELKIKLKGKKHLFQLDNIDEIHSLLMSIWENFKDEETPEQKTLASKKSIKTLKRISVEEHDLGGGMTKSDWQKVQQGFKCITYKKNEPVISKGSNNHRIYQIAKGRCRIEINRNSETHIVGYVDAGGLLGEIGFLEDTEATASVIADEDSIDVYVIEGYFINILFVKYPDLAGRFYCYLASVLAERLREREETIDDTLGKK